MDIQMGMTFLSQKKIENNEFEQIMREHKRWLQDKSTGKRADFRDIDLSEKDLSGIDLSYADLQGSNLMDAKLIGANLSYANLTQAFLHGADLSKAIIDGASFTNANLARAKLDECTGENARFTFSCLWDCDFKNVVLPKAVFFEAEVCDCDFTGSNLEEAYFVHADLDNSVFEDTNLKNADFDHARRAYWSNFRNADMTGASVENVNLDLNKLEGVKGLYIPLYCPEEGSFTAWKKCREGKVVKLLIPEHAERKGNSIYSLRASEAEVLEIYDKDGNSVDEAVSIVDAEFKYLKGTTVYPKEVNPKFYGDTTGIYFVLSRAETEIYKEKEERAEKGDDVDEE